MCVVVRSRHRWCPRGRREGRLPGRRYRGSWRRSRGRTVGGRGRGLSSLAWRNAVVRRGYCAANKGAGSRSRCPRKTRGSFRLRWAWDEGDRHRLRNLGAGRGARGKWRGGLLELGRLWGPFRDERIRFWCNERLLIENGVRSPEMDLLNYSLLVSAKSLKSVRWKF